MMVIESTGQSEGHGIFKGRLVVTFVDRVLRVVHPVRMQIGLRRVRLEIVLGRRVVIVVGMASSLAESTSIVTTSRN